MRALVIATCIAACVLSFAFGVYTAQHKTRVYLERHSEYNFWGQYAVTKGRTNIPCPPQTPDTAVLVAIGQSNAGNSLGQRYASRDESVVNYFDGKCYIAEDPLLGASGNRGSIWTLVGRKLIQSRGAKRVVLIALAIGSSSVTRWRIGGDLNWMLKEQLSLAKASGYVATHVLWHQGEADHAMLAESYRDGLREVAATTRISAPNSAFLVAIASWCAGVSSEQVQQGQRLAVDRLRNIFQGPNTDLFIDTEHRFDHCHLSALAQEPIAGLWVDAIMQARSRPWAGDPSH